MVCCEDSTILIFFKRGKREQNSMIDNFFKKNITFPLENSVNKKNFFGGKVSHGTKVLKKI